MSSSNITQGVIYILRKHYKCNKLRKELDQALLHQNDTYMHRNIMENECFQDPGTLRGHLTLNF